MKQTIFLSIVLSLFFINNKDVLANREKRAAPPAQFKPILFESKDPRVVPQKYCDTKCIPTVKPISPFDPIKDAESLSKAVKGAGTNEDSIINILTKRGIIQRLQIAEAYKTKFGVKKDVVTDIAHDISGRFDESIVQVMTPIPMILARDLEEVMRDKKAADTVVMVEILGGISNYGVKTVAEVYKAVYGKTLESDVTGYLSQTGSFQKLILMLLQGKRDEKPEVDNAKAIADAKTLAGPTRWSTNPTELHNILTGRTFLHLKSVYLEYKKIKNADIEDTIQFEFTGIIGEGYRALVKLTKNKARFYAERLYLGMKGIGFIDKRMIRIIVTRSEIDLGDIKTEYQAFYGKGLEEAVATQIGGHYRRVLTFLIRG